MNGCKECIVYRLQYNQMPAEMCNKCNTQTLCWKQNDDGAVYLECPRCHEIVGVDFNTPCETDAFFRQKRSIIVEPQIKSLDNKRILNIAKYFHVNALQMREKLIQGCLIETKFDDFYDAVRFLKQQGITYKVNEIEDPRNKYPYYKKCNSPYSSMKRYLQDDEV